MVIGGSEGECPGEMRKEEALRAIYNEWLRRPESERQSEGQLAAFAMSMANDPLYAFRYSGDRYQAVMGHLMSLVRGLKR
jgi:hypothetical protein